MKQLSLSVAFCLWAVIALAVKPTHLVLLIGQSNMAGRGAMLEEDRQPIPNVVMLDKTGEWVPARSPVHFDKKTAGFGLCTPFAKAWLADHPGETLGLVPCAVGGTSIARWLPGRDLYTNAVSRAKLAAKDAPWAAILWHQGETDVGNPKRMESYAKDAATMFASFRKELHAEDVPVVLGELGEWWGTKGEQFNRQILPAVAQAVPHSAIASSKGLVNNPKDKPHFVRDSYILLGNRYYDAFKKLTAKE